MPHENACALCAVEDCQHLGDAWTCRAVRDARALEDLALEEA